MTSNLPAPEWFDAKKIIAQYVEGKDTDTIAKGLGVSRAKLVHQLTIHHPDDWREAQAIRQIRRMEEAEDDIDAAAEAGDYQKAKANEIKLKSAQWAVERVLRRIYGEPREREIVNPVQININLRRDDGARETKTINAVDLVEREGYGAESGRPAEDAKFNEKTPKAEKLPAHKLQKATPKKPAERSVLQIPAPVPPSPTPGSGPIDYGDGPIFP